ncbi:MAG: hypothetical protein HYX69_16325 [Planctomycetia bacterium]|nr:hypothetical protein [Planctomycetia bacterium]
MATGAGGAANSRRFLSGLSNFDFPGGGEAGAAAVGSTIGFGSAGGRPASSSGSTERGVFGSTRGGREGAIGDRNGRARTMGLPAR